MKLLQSMKRHFSIASAINVLMRSKVDKLHKIQQHCYYFYSANHLEFFVPFRIFEEVKSPTIIVLSILLKQKKLRKLLIGKIRKLLLTRRPYLHTLKMFNERFITHATLQPRRVSNRKIWLNNMSFPKLDTPLSRFGNVPLN